MPPTTHHPPLHMTHQPHIKHPPHLTHAFPCIPTYIPQLLSCYFTPSTPPTHPTPPIPSQTSLHISPNVCHVTSHHPLHPTHTFPCIPTHIPQCLSCYFTLPHTTNPHLPMHPYSTLHLNIFKGVGSKNIL